jgi:hypothetical protein
MGYKCIDKGSDYTPCPPGNHVGRVYQVLFLGTVPTEFKGVKSDKPMVRIGFELPNELMDDGRPFTIATMPIPASMNKKANFLKLVRGIVALTPETEKEFDVESLIGATCLVNVIHKEGKESNVYANITGCSPLPKGTVVPDAVNEPFLFDVTTSPLELLDNMADFIVDQVKLTPEYRARTNF